MVIFYLPACGLSLIVRLRWGKSWAIKVGSLTWNLLSWEPGWQSPLPQASGLWGWIQCSGPLLLHSSILSHWIPILAL